MLPGDQFIEMQSCSYPQTLWVRTTLYFTRLFIKQKLHGNSQKLSKMLGNAPLINAHILSTMFLKNRLPLLAKDTAVVII